MKKAFFALALIFWSVFGSWGQSSPEDDFAGLLEEVLLAAEEGDWQKSFNLLEQARQLDPENPLLEEYQTSILSMQALSTAQESWIEGVPHEVESSEQVADVPETDTDGPKFVIDRGKQGNEEDPALHRDFFTAAAGFSFFNLDMNLDVTSASFSTPQEYFTTGIQADLRYWLPLGGRFLGFGLRYDGFFWRNLETTIYYYLLDFDLRVRGFLIESVDSRLELGLNLGISFLNTFDSKEKEKDIFTPIIFGIFLSDPLFYHLFDIEALEPLVIEGELQLYTFLETLTLDLISYRLETYWRFPFWRLGLRFDVDDFIREGNRESVWSLGFLAGFQL